MAAQSEGNNAITSNTTGSIVASAAYIDASPFYYGSGLDICQTVYNILSSSSMNYATNYPNGAVIDARGILPTQVNSSLQCSKNPFPTTAFPPAMVLLPGETIQISHMWTLPSNTRIIGEGAGVQNYTALGAVSGFSDTAMIQMGPSGGASATGVVVEHLKLDGEAAGAFDGIDNVSAGDGSYVNDVAIGGIGATPTKPTSAGSACTPSGGTVTSLCISQNATYSGPYTNFNITPSTTCSGGITCPSTACVKIQAQTRGLRDITCVAGSNCCY
jgi:hypothetical protein